MSAIDEDTLIKSRPLQSEERPFKRITKRCTTLISSSASLEDDFAKWSEDIDLDVEYFELTIARIQLLQETNKREIERYEREKVNILNASEKARLDMVLLRDELVLAQQEKQNKLIYDAIATDILSNRALKTRDEQRINLARLEQEIAELEEEKRQYGLVWQARRAQFGEIVRQLEKMQAQIQEDKEEHDRREGMDEEEGEEGEEIEHPTRPELQSGATTPRSTIHTTSATTAAQTPTSLALATNAAPSTHSESLGSGLPGNGSTPAPNSGDPGQSGSAPENKDITMEDVASKECSAEVANKREGGRSIQAPVGDPDKMDTT